MSIEEFTALKIGAKVSIQRGLKSPPLKGTLADKVNESALIKRSHAGRKTYPDMGALYEIKTGGV